ncbi:MAG: hypothetical protein GX654_02990 [Desulfatiglans sp.]|nr:hypothetical protein [Desulfatiglans sp.]
MIQSLTRPINEKEKRFLRLKIRELSKHIDESPVLLKLLKQVCFGFGISGFLCFLGSISTDDQPPFWFYLLIFIVPGLVWTLWFFIKKMKDEKAIISRIQTYKDASNNGTVKVTRIKTDRMFEAEEYEDEGACYFFEVEKDKVFLIMGQEYYSTTNFPNSDFSIIEIIDTKGQLVDSIIEKQGKKLKPLRLIPREDKIKIDLTNDNKLIPCSLDHIESYLNIS